MPQPAPAAMKPVILADHYPISAMISVGPADFCLKKTRPTLGSSSAADKASATCYLVEQLQYLYVRVVREHGVAARSSSAPVAVATTSFASGATLAMGAAGDLQGGRRGRACVSPRPGPCRHPRRRRTG